MGILTIAGFYATFFARITGYEMYLICALSIYGVLIWILGLSFSQFLC